MSDSDMIIELLERAREAKENNNRPEALECYNMILEANETHEAAARGKADLLKEWIGDLLRDADEKATSRDWPMAEGLYNQVLSLDRSNPRASQGLARLKQKAEHAENVLKLSAEGDEAFADKKYSQAAAKYQQAINHSGQHDIREPYAGLEANMRRAEHLVSWEKRVSEAIENVKAASKDGDSENVLAKLEELRAEMPMDDEFRPLAERLDMKRDEIEHNMIDSVRYNKAHDAFSDEDFDEAIRLAELIPDTSSYHGQAQVIVSSSKETLHEIRHELDRAEDAINDQDWATAYVELKKIKDMFPKSPIWRRHWLQAGKSDALQHLDAGRNANAADNFKKAREDFRKANERLKELLEFYPEHPDVRALAHEVGDLIEIVTLEEQAQDAWGRGERTVARSALAQAQTILRRAKDEERDYTTVADVIAANVTKLEDEIDRHAQGERALADGARRLENNDLQSAIDAFRQVLDSFDPVQRERAKEGINKAETQIALFERHYNAGKATADAATQVEEFQKAYALWPNGRDVAALLEDSLIAAGKAADEQAEAATATDAEQFEAAAIGYYGRARELNPQNREAERALKARDLKPRVMAALKVNEAARRALADGEQTTAESFTEELNKIDALLVEAEAIPRLRDTLRRAKRATEAAQRQWRELEEAYRRATEARATGDWEAAAERLAAGLAHFGEAIPPHYRRLSDDWANTARVVAGALDIVTARLAEVDTLYQQLPQTRDVSPALEALDKADAAVNEAQSAAQESNGRLPAALLQQAEELKTWRSRLDAIRLALGHSEAHDSMTSLKAQLDSRPRDAVLSQLYDHYHQLALARVPDLERDANDAWAVGDSARALALMRQARELDPQNKQWTSTFQQWQRENTRREKLDQFEANYEILTREGKLAEALNTLADMLRALEGGGLNQPMKRSLDELLKYRNFGDDNDWNQAQIHLQALSTQAEDGGWTASRAATIAERWADLARKVGLEGIVSSAADLGTYVEGFMAADKLRLRYLDDPKYVAEAVAMNDKMMDRMRVSAEGRLARAKELLEKENYESACQTLETIETIYDEVRKPLPQRFALDEEVKKQQELAQTLAQRADQLKEVYNRIAPLLVAAQDHLVSSRLDEAEAELKKAGDLSDVKHLEEKVKQLKEQIRTARQEMARQALDDAITRAEAALVLAVHHDEFQKVIHDLEQFAPDMLQTLHESDRQRHQTLLDKALTRREKLEEGQKWSEMAKVAFDEQRYDEAATAYEQALLVERSGRIRADLQQRLDDANRHLENKRLGREALARANAALEEARTVAPEDLSTVRAQLLNAQKDLSEAEGYGFDVGDRRRLVNVGKLVLKARQFMASQQLDLADDELKAASEELEQHPQQRDDLVRGFRREINRLENQRTATVAVQRDLQEAQRNLLQGRMDEAEASANRVLTYSPDDGTAANILTSVDVYRKAQEKVRRVQAWRDDPTNFQKALTELENTQQKLQISWPVYDEVNALKDEFERAIVKDRNIASIQGLISEGKFGEARTNLNTAAEMGAEGEELRTLRTMIDEAQQRLESQVLQPLQSRLRDGQYREALELSRRERSVRSPEVKRKIEEAQGKIVNQWARDVYKSFEGKLNSNEAHSIEELEGFNIEMRDMLELTPKPSDEIRREVERVQRSVAIRQLDLRLQELEQATKGPSPQWDAIEESLTSVGDEARRLQEKAQTANRRDQALQLSRILHRVGELKLAIVSLREKERLAQDAARREELMTEARRQATNAAGGEDLAAAAKLVGQVLAIPRYQDDAEATRLKSELEAEQRHFRATELALERSRGHIRDHEFDQAKAALRQLHPVSRLRADVVAKLTKILDWLVRADEYQDSARWEEALDDYEAAIALDPSLVGDVLADDLKRCRLRILEKYTDQIDVDLRLVPPNVKTASDRLEREVIKKLAAGGDFKDIFTRLRDRITSQEYLAQAIQILDGEGDAQPAVDLLQQARAAVADNTDLDANLMSWEALAQAAVLWAKKDRDLAGAETNLTTLRSPVADRKRAKLLRAETQEFREKLQNVSAYLDTARRSLEAAPPNYSSTVDALRHVLDLDPSNRDASTMRDTVAAQMRMEIEQARQHSLAYSNALFLAGLLRKLYPENDEMRQLERVLSDERQARLETNYGAAEDALTNYDLDRLNETLARLEAILSPDTHEKLTRLQGQRDGLVKILPEVNGKIAQARQHLDARRWEAAVAAALDARQQASGYAAVAAVAAEIQTKIAGQASDWLSARKLKDAISLVELGSQFGTRAELTKERDAISWESSRIFTQQRNAIQQALDNWQLEEADQALGDTEWYLLKQLPETGNRRKVLDGLRQLHNAKKELAPTIRNHIAAGWQNLGHQDFDQASIQFLRAAHDYKEKFSEGQDWASYADYLQEAAAAVRGENFPVAIERLAAAEGFMTSKPQNQLASILDGSAQLTERRRQAAWDAHRLRKMVTDMAKKYQESKEAASLHTTNGYDRSMALLNEVIALKTGYNQALSIQNKPPQEYEPYRTPADVAGAAGTVAAKPVAEEVAAPPAEAQVEEPARMAATGPADSKTLNVPSQMEPEPAGDEEDHPARLASAIEEDDDAPESESLTTIEEALDWLNRLPASAAEPSLAEAEASPKPAAGFEESDSASAAPAAEPTGLVPPAISSPGPRTPDGEAPADDRAREKLGAEDGATPSDPQPSPDDETDTSSEEAMPPLLSYEAIMGLLRPTPIEDIEDES